MVDGRGREGRQQRLSDDAMVITLGLHLKTKDNQHTHWRGKAKVSQVERRAAYYSVLSIQDRLPFPVRVTITRCGPRSLDPTNMGSACKAIIDGIADAYGYDDRDRRFQWEFRQRKEKTYSVEISIEPVSREL